VFFVVKEIIELFDCDTQDLHFCFLLFLTSMKLYTKFIVSKLIH